MDRQANFEAGFLELQNQFGIRDVVLRAKRGYRQQIWKVASFGRIGSPASLFCEKVAGACVAEQSFLRLSLWRLSRCLVHPKRLTFRASVASREKKKSMRTPSAISCQFGLRNLAWPCERALTTDHTDETDI